MAHVQALGLGDEELAACQGPALQAADVHNDLLAWALSAVPKQAAEECAPLT